MGESFFSCSGLAMLHASQRELQKMRLSLCQPYHCWFCCTPVLFILFILFYFIYFILFIFVIFVTLGPRSCT